MFTGIIEAVGQIAAIEEQAGDCRIYIKTAQLDMADVRLGDSIAVNGVCLTVTELLDAGFVADVSLETMTHTRFNALQLGEAVNLEKALQLGQRLGGHLVSGHVDGLGKVLEREEDARSIRFEIQAPEGLLPFLATKGSVTIDGVSLTVNEVRTTSFMLNIVPHTAAKTIMINYQVGTLVHIEVDMIARYLERLLSCGVVETASHDLPESGLTMEKLIIHGFHS